VLAGTDKVYRYGTPGQGQTGIEFYADEAAGRTAYQCRQARSASASIASWRFTPLAKLRDEERFDEV